MYVAVCHGLRLSTHTLHLSAQLLLRVMSTFRLQHERIVTVALTCVTIAAKYHEKHIPRLEMYPLVLNTSQIDISQILPTESVVLNAISFELGFPTSFEFAAQWCHDHTQQLNVLVATSLHRSVSCDCHSNLCFCNWDRSQVHHVFLSVVSYLLELCLLQPSLMAFPPSLVAASSIALTANVLNLDELSLSWHWEYASLSDLDSTCLAHMNQLAQMASLATDMTRIIHNKYKQPRNNKASLLVAHHFECCHK